MITWNQVKLLCLDYFEREKSFQGDAIAQREFWLTATDDLSRCGLITQQQRDNWSCPF
jgi:hypothetical protein